MSTWTPDQRGLLEVMELLANSRKGNTQIQRECTKKMNELNNNVPDFNIYLVHIFVRCKDIEPAIRQAAGLILKANLKQKLVTLQDAAKDHLKLLLLEALGDEIQFIRSTAGTLISFILYWDTVEAWPTCISQLVSILTNNTNNVTLISGVMDCMSKVCEDNYSQFVGSYADQLAYLIPTLIRFLEYPSENVKRDALGSILHFFQLDPLPTHLLNNMDSFLKNLFNIANENAVVLRKYSCRAFVMLLDTPEFLRNAISTVFEYIIHCISSEDETLALEACEFWTVLLDLDPKNSCQQFYPILQNYLPQLVPVLLEKMQYSEFEQQSLLHDSERPDRESDIDPSVYHVKPKDTIEEEGQYDEDDEDYEDWDEENGGDDWSLRKCAATSLDLLSNIFGSSILPFLLPQIEKKMSPEMPWPVKESAILALGAISEGCMTGMLQHLPKLIPYMLTLIDDDKPLVRNITCWSLSRYSRWIVEQPLDRYFEPVLAAILKKMLDKNKVVQEAASSAFATLEDHAKTLLIPYLKPVLETIASAFQIYQKKNVFILYDAIRTLSDSVGAHLNKPVFIQLIIPPLITKWNSLSDDDKDLLPLLECLTGVSTALQSGFQSFAAPVFQRCLRIIQNTYAMETKNPEEADKDFVICALDLIGGILEGLGTSATSLILTGPELLNVLFLCIKDKIPEVRQSALGVIGDLAKESVEYLRGALSEFLPIMIANLNPKTASVCSNSCWALGEITLRIGTDITPYATEMLAKMIPILNSSTTYATLVENLSVSIGRIGLVCPKIVSTQLPTICKNLCMGLTKARNKTEREHGYAGLCAIVRENPQGAITHFPFVLDAISNCPDPSAELKHEFITILQGFKQGMGEQAWSSFLSTIPEDITLKLRQEYNI
ncbi:hypothetical protein FDP41_010914 [Naegleria fowleri]|uniref:Importin N-terminal domain-containing protein n=1 Tax=Naegleria fowleri TaxID=5763 RepID=A0A6A5CC58_NAEFO|nr:uncharacterized protein FDP41_010914 [Naegleria fowleri]KAF0982935.1 hypothetical protein FDP41_010914 [Naegleria fowleri]